MLNNFHKIAIGSFLVISAFSFSCTEIRTIVNPKSPEEVRGGITRFIAQRRADPTWMDRSGCPAEHAVKAGRAPGSVNPSCEQDPERCLAKCENGDGTSCFTLALVTQKNDAVESDVADVLFRKACKLQISAGCTNAAAPLSDSEDQDKLACAARTFEATCASKDPWGCTMDGLMRMEGLGRDVDAEGAKRSFERGCELGAATNYDEPCNKGKELQESFRKAAESRTQGDNTSK